MSDYRRKSYRTDYDRGGSTDYRNGANGDYGNGDYNRRGGSRVGGSSFRGGRPGGSSRSEYRNGASSTISDYVDCRRGGTRGGFRGGYTDRGGGGTNIANGPSTYPTQRSDNQPAYQPTQDANPPPCKITKVDQNEELIQSLITHVKSNGVFDSLRKMCSAAVDSKDAYLDMIKRVTITVNQTTQDLSWTPELNPNHIREKMKKRILDEKYFQSGLDVVVDQIIKGSDLEFSPLIEQSVSAFLTEKEAKERAIQVKVEKERQEKERIENERTQKETEERTRMQLERDERERIENEKIQREKERLEQIRLTEERERRTRMENQAREKQRLENEARAKLMLEEEDYEESSESDDDESPVFEALQQASPPRVTREEIDQKFSLEMQAELRRLTIP